MTTRRVLITGLSTLWGGRLARALEADPGIETVIGIDRRPPKVQLERTEFVRVTDAHSLIRRIVEAAEIDTVVDTRLVTDSGVTSPRRTHENNVIGTMNVLAGCSGPDSPVRKVVFRSSTQWYGANQDDPAFFTEAMRRRHPPDSPLERSIVEAEAQVADFAARNRDKTTTVLRVASGLGPNLSTSTTRLLSGPVVPAILGFDPRVVFIHEDDIANCLEHAVRFDLPGTFNCAADGVLVLSEVASLLGKPLVPLLPPVATGLAARAVRPLGLELPPEVLSWLRFGRGVDNRRWKATGFRFAHTTRETVQRFAEVQRLAPMLRGQGEAYRYEEEVEEFLRRSPSVRREAAPPELSNRPPGTSSAAGPGERREGGRPTAPADLPARELIALLPEMTPQALEALRRQEEAGPARRTVLRAIDARLAEAAG